MGQITSNVGLISGINTGALINALLSEDSAPISLLQTQITSAQNQQTEYGKISTQLQSLQQIGNTLALPQTFQNADANSSDPSVLSATTTVGAAQGTYQFQVARLVSTQQSISTGFSDTSSPIDPAGGSITLELGGGEANSQTPLSQLNGGAGVPPGQFRITDASGHSAVIDTSSDITLDDVVKQINTAQGTSILATVTDNGLVLTDQSGGSGTLSVQDLNGGSTAKNLGLTVPASGPTLTGANINFISSSTSVGTLNDGNGISTAGPAQNDFTLTAADGTVINVTLSGAKTVGDILNDINNATSNTGASKVRASINSSGNGIQLTDTSGGGGTLTLAADNGSQAAVQLGLTSPASAGVISGKPLIAGLDSVLVSSLRGQNGAGVNLGTISVTNTFGTTGTINLSGAVSVSDILSDINGAGLDLNASINPTGNGIQIIDNSGGSGTLSISDLTGTSAHDLGIAVTNSTSNTDVGTNLQRQYVSGNTTLGNYNGGEGVPLGQFQIVNSNGVSATLDLTQGTFNTLGDVIAAINAKNVGVTASINSTGNGLLLTDTAGGTGELSVTDLNDGTTAADLNIAGSATGTGASNVINGAEQKTITVSSTDTLSTLQTKINQAGFGVTANIINDGSSTSPYRLSLTASNSGAAGRVLIDSGTTGLGITNLVNGQNAAVFYGGSGGSQPLLITSNTNQLSNVIKGVVVNLTSASSSPVTLSITPDASNVSTQLQNFVTAFNSAIGTVSTDSQYNTTTNQGGILLGDGTTQQIETALYALLNSTVTNAGQYKDLADIGITINTNGSTDAAQIQFDQNTFNQAFASNPTAVQNLFSQLSTGLGAQIASTIGTLTDPVNGAVTLEDTTLTNQISQYNDSITQLNAVLAEQRTNLQNEFNNMETTLSSLQTQQTILNSFVGVSASTSSTAKSSVSNNVSSIGS